MDKLIINNSGTTTHSISCTGSTSSSNVRHNEVIDHLLEVNCLMSYVEVYFNYIYTVEFKPTEALTHVLLYYCHCTVNAP